MTMAAVIRDRTADHTPPSDALRIARIEVLHEMQAAERAWRVLESRGHLSTPYQRFDFLFAWQHAVGQREGLRPFLVIAYDDIGQPLVLLPLAVKRESGVHAVQFLGGKHATFNMALWNSEFANRASRADLDALVQAIGKQAQKVDLVFLTRQPKYWMGQPNPLALLPHQPSVNECPLMTMTPGSAPTDRISNSFRRRLKGKERKISSLPGYRYHVAMTDADITGLLDAFFTIKPLRMALQKLPNVFANPGVEEFIRRVCLTQRPGGGRIVDIHALECDEEVIAIFAGVADGQRFSMMFNTYTLSPHARYSPGLILMRNIVDYYAARRYTSIDLGIGTDGYKRLFCKSDEPIFDSFIPLSAVGKVAAINTSAMNRIKRRIKKSAALMQMVHRVRTLIHR